MKRKKKKNSKRSIGATNYPVGDFLVRIKNAGLAGKKEVSSYPTNLIKDLAKTLVKVGYLKEVGEKDGMLKVKIAYHKKQPLLSDLKLVSRPGLRVYMKVSELESWKSPSLLVLTTPKGVMTNLDAVKKRLGGEVIAEIL